MAISIDPTPGNVAIAQLKSIPFGDLIGAPLNAAIEAQGKAAISTYDFIKAVGLQTNSNNMLEAITVAFSYQTSTGESRNVIVPLLAIVPIPLIIIDELTISFKANISAEASTSESTADSSAISASASGDLENWFVKSNFQASYSSKKDSTATANSRYSVEYTMDVNVHAAQAGMPAGLATVLQILSNSSTTVKASGQINLSAPGTQLQLVDDTLTIGIGIVGGMNRPIAGIVPTVTSSSSSVTVPATVTATDEFGQTSVTLTYASRAPDTSVVITVSASGKFLSDTETFTVQLG